MVTISFGVPARQRSSRMLPPAINRYWIVISTGPWPISVLPVHEPTSVFMRVNSGEPALAFSASTAFAPSEAASNRVEQRSVMFVFMVFIGFLYSLIVTFMNTTNDQTGLGQPR